ncbi:MAG: 50S ribosomal protein L18 [Candidatus Magasanikbacteria bacterium CG_4_10_14_0_2_um_filter_37_12]|uniref:Large ribosomal subunit protein uL18 n=1 Tax=Candidatus Magasanikbacteria bacterium CG_4_10_14_0_2_um_filter_37_12 TaxID=1974637 RepID=A0A2M7V8S6_9BACT|nr:MAG: 50S ribosomal protein L18 [Candidatus Magasanikbacteria bacterium CG_4_10_14_0_2_um_filter_37_12]
MNTKKQSRESQRNRRRIRVRSIIIGTSERPRLNVYRGLRHMYIQLIDDQNGTTLVGLHSKNEVVNGDAGERKGAEAKAYLLGKILGEKAQALKVTTIVFDRAGYKYHGRVKAVADGARDSGLIF